VIARANDTDFGLGGSVWSSDRDRAFEMAARINAGTVWVNKHHDLNRTFRSAARSIPVSGSSLGMRDSRNSPSRRSSVLPRARGRRRRYSCSTQITALRTLEKAQKGLSNMSLRINDSHPAYPTNHSASSPVVFFRVCSYVGERSGSVKKQHLSTCRLHLPISSGGSHVAEKMCLHSLFVRRICPAECSCGAQCTRPQVEWRLAEN